MKKLHKETRRNQPTENRPGEKEKREIDRMNERERETSRHSKHRIMKTSSVRHCAKLTGRLQLCAAGAAGFHFTVLINNHGQVQSPGDA